MTAQYTITIVADSMDAAADVLDDCHFNWRSDSAYGLQPNNQPELLEALQAIAELASQVAVYDIASTAVAKATGG